jgi:beta-glucosidase
MSTMLDLISGSGTISEETSKEASDLAVAIAEEGTMLLENEGVLPLAEGTKLNVFGWASTNPMLGGGGSGALNTAYESVSLLQSLNDAGIETNTELSDFYTAYKADRPVCGMWAQDWTLPEPNVSKYTDSMMSNAKAFSNKHISLKDSIVNDGAILVRYNDLVGTPVTVTAEDNDILTAKVEFGNIVTDNCFLGNGNIVRGGGHFCCGISCCIVFAAGSFRARSKHGKHHNDSKQSRCDFKHKLRIHN